MSGKNIPAAQSDLEPSLNSTSEAGATGRVVLKLVLYGGVALFCLFLLAALVIPWLNQQREGSRRAVCMNNIRNLGLAIVSYETSHRAYPGYREGLKIEKPVELGGVATDTVPVHWLVALLPTLERSDLYRKWENLTGVEISTTGQVLYSFPQKGDEVQSPLDYISTLVCPNDSRVSQPAGQGQPISYVVNSGLQDVAATTKYPADWPANGVFVSRWEMPQPADAEPLLLAKNNADDVSRGDGVSTTLLLGENTGARNYDDVFLNAGGLGALQKPVSEQWGCFIWHPVDPLPPDLSQVRINGRPANGDTAFPTPAPDITYARPSSHHPGGANFVYCDTHTKFISDKIDYLLFELLMTSNGSQATTPGLGLPVPAVFTTTPLDEGGCFESKR